MNKRSHYYGDLVRKLFLAGAIFMLLMLPFMSAFIEAPLYISILAAIAIGVIAGITNPAQAWAAALNFIIALVGSFIFEYQAVMGYTTYSYLHRTFWANQLLAINFLVALYYATKTVRGMLVK
ncbi:MAG: photosystem I protein PsaX [Candidatus Levyibacteriota bacterium]